WDSWTRQRPQRTTWRPRPTRRCRAQGSAAPAHPPELSRNDASGTSGCWPTSRPQDVPSPRASGSGSSPHCARPRAAGPFPASTSGPRPRLTAASHPHRAPPAVHHRLPLAAVPPPCRSRTRRSVRPLLPRHRQSPRRRVPRRRRHRPRGPHRRRVTTTA
ncbi:MAG: hypothetical protein AVDCRST_MAG34-3079, partial [uncultured Nocardioidaceae bacterium]